ncbi:MAG TPA: hypothetical protein PKA13_12360 [Geminicoccaceae bacterium]|nr:hypothetical protein [Geminicoccus sp.]HMU50559.1 hypothetical protein [Geminicoccaceae bacterium]
MAAASPSSWAAEAITPPAALVERRIEDEPGGSLSMDYRPGGLVCSFVLPLPEGDA